MAHFNTPLVSELMQVIPLQTEFENWRQAGKIPARAIRDLCASLRQDERFSGQPGRFYSSAAMIVAYTYDAWFALQASRQQRLDGLKRWIDILKSDADILELCSLDWDSFRASAKEILQRVIDQLQADQPKLPLSRRGSQQQRERSDRTVSKRQLVNQLFELYDESSSLLTRCVAVHLLKNGCAVLEKPEKPERYQHMLLSKQKAAKRLEEQLASRLPKGRDLTDKTFLEALELLTHQIPNSAAELAQWKAQLLRKPNPLPYPILYGSNNDLTWFVEERPRGKGKPPKQQICVKFNGLGEHVFKVQCDRRQHHYFQRFVQDWDVYKRGKGPISGSLLLLRTASLLWKPANQSSHQPTGNPWQDNYLYLHCQIDTQLLTREGIEQKRQKKLNSTQNPNLYPPDSASKVAKQRQGHLNRLQPIEQYPIPLPSREPHEGQPHLILGVSFALQHPVTLAVVDLRSKQSLYYRSTRQLLKTTNAKTDQSHLLRQQKIQQQRHNHERHKALKREHYAPYQEANLGNYLNQVLAKRVVDAAYQAQVSAIVLPETRGLRDKLEAQLRAQAAIKIVGSVAAQKRYARAASLRLHHWSYNQLAELIKSKAAKLGIPVEVVPALVADNPQETARNVALSAYYRRQAATK
ncbi:type V CRISPR-associated protein Cas12k [Leptolyngbya subtilissima AS-A7]